MEVLKDKFSEWTHPPFKYYYFSRYEHLEFKKQRISLGKYSPYAISESGNKFFKF